MKNHTLKEHEVKTSKNIKTFIFLCFSSVVLTGCMDGYYKPADNKLKTSPCACNEVIYDSREIG